MCLDRYLDWMSGYDGSSDPAMWFNCVPLRYFKKLVEATTVNCCERYVALAAITGNIILPSVLPCEELLETPDS